MSANSLISGAFVVALVHAILPNHWLPFVLIGSVEKWNRKRILGVLTLAGVGHILVTAGLGFITAFIGKEVIERIELKIPIASIILLTFGIIYIILNLRKHKHTHSHSKHRKFTTAFSLFLMLTLTPCEPMIVVYFTMGTFGLKFLILLTLVMAITTLCGMLTLTYFTLLGYERVKFQWLEKNERLVIGIILLILGILFMFHHHPHCH
jgi:putative Mn2+ efflux pump MntP